MRGTILNLVPLSIVAQAFSMMVNDEWHSSLSTFDDVSLVIYKGPSKSIKPQSKDSSHLNREISSHIDQSNLKCSNYG